MTPCNRLIDALLPRHCLLCGAGVSGPACICRGCHSDLPWLDSSCYRCALPLPADTPLCGACLRRRPPFTRTLAAFTFTPPVDSLIQGYKHRRQLATGALLSQLLAPQLQHAYSEDSLPACIVPVPLHWRRLLQRGFNQAALVAQQLGRTLALPVVNGCRRRFHTAPQQGADRRHRQANLRGAFTLRHPLTDDHCYDHIAIVDDVVTTTSTVSELAALLLAAGVRRVDIWCLARTPQTG